jgi:hypothetical protein
MLETLWVERPGWGFILRRDLWTRRECSEAQLITEGYVRRNTPSAENAKVCPSCNMYIDGIPGSLVAKHMSQCRGGAEDSSKIEETLIQDQRMKMYERKLRLQREQELAELLEAERRERFDKVKEENLARQQGKDRKARLKREAREQLRKR